MSDAAARPVTLLVWISATAALLLVALLALSPPFTGLADGLRLDPAHLLATARYAALRTAAVNTFWLWLGVGLPALALSWAWARLGGPARPSTLWLLPLLLPGALIGLLWRPLLEPWLVLARPELTLALTGGALLWRAVPVMAWLWQKSAGHGQGLRRALAAHTLLLLSDAGLILTLSGGEPYNATHTLPSWAVQQLAVQRAWGPAAAALGGLAAIVAGVAWWMKPRPLPPSKGEGSREGDSVPPSSLGEGAAGVRFLLLWIAAPFVPLLPTLAAAPLPTLPTLATLGLGGWLLNAAGIIAAAWGMAATLARILPPPTAATRAVTLGLLPLTALALAYARQALPAVPPLLWLAAWLALGAAGIAPRRDIGASLAAVTLLLAHSLPVQFMLALPAAAWLPASGVVWTLAQAPGPTQAAALLGAGMAAGGAAWLVARRPHLG